MTATTRKMVDHAPTQPAHHLTDELLLDYASGACDEATALVIATHLTLCPICRKRAEMAEALGGTLIEDLPPADMAGGALERLMARLDEPETRQADTPPPAAPRAAGGTGTVLPRALQRYLGGDLDAVDWQPLGLGVERADIEVSGDSRAFMLRVPPGRAVPQHTHKGNEYVVILQGGYTDALGHFGRGDIAIGDPSIEHKPIADPGEACVCLAVTDQPLKLTGMLGTLLNPFVKI